jgi:Hypothetical glycosyl hydrolase family 15
MRARVWLVALLAAAVLPAAPAGARTAAVGQFATMIDTHAPLPDPALTATRRRVVVLQSWRTADALRLKLANPHVTVLAYLDLSAMSPAAPNGFSTGVQTRGPGSRQRYAAAHPGWYLHTRRGARFTFSDYSWLWAANVGAPGYAAQWGRNAARLLASHPEFDGIFIDDVNPTLGYHWDPANVRELPSDAAYQAATGRALTTITARIHGLGRLAYANLGAWADFGEQVRPWLAHLDGAMDEQWVKWGSRAGSGWRDEGGWARQVANVAGATAAGVTVLAVTHSSNRDAAAARYGYASALLASQGRVLFESTADYHSDPWFADYDTDVGAPAGPMTADPTGVRRRAFTRGLVLVNPTDAPQAADLGGTYSGDGLRRATSARLAAHSALILVRETPPAPAGSAGRSSP